MTEELKYPYILACPNAEELYKNKNYDKIVQALEEGYDIIDLKVWFIKYEKAAKMLAKRSDFALVDYECYNKIIKLKN